MLKWLYNTFNSFVIDITKPILTPIIQSIYVINLLVVSTFIRNITLLEAIIISDGIYNALTFAKEYIYYKIKIKLISNNTNTIDVDIKKELLKNYNNLYILNIFDRYILYFILYIIYKLTIIITWSFNIILLDNDNIFYKFIDNTLYILILLLIFPYIQNTILKMHIINKYIDIYLSNKNVFIGYSFSKITINFIKNLDSRIDFIKNSQIFVLYRHISFKLFIDFIKSYCFIYVLYFLRNNQSTYYYYKMIKLAYYYNTGHLFNQISIEDSIYIVNIIVLEKKWNDLANLEIVHAFYRLIDNKYNNNGNIYITLSLYFAKFITLWNFICLLKIFKTEIITLLMFIFFIIEYKLNNKRYNITKIKENLGIILVLYFLLLFNVNDLVISTIFVLYKLIYLIYCELVFFITNLNDIHKILSFYQNKQLKLESRTIDVNNI